LPIPRAVSVTVTVTGPLPGKLGVPEIRPVEVMPRPGGRPVARSDWYEHVAVDLLPRRRHVAPRTGLVPQVPVGPQGAVLRREGLYSSHVIEWRRARDAGALAGPARPRGRPAADPRDAQIARLRQEKAKLEQELAKARFVVDVQSRLQALLEMISESADTEPGSSS
jgi:transposase